MNDRRTFLKGAGCASLAAAAKAAFSSGSEPGERIDFDSPVSVCIQTEGAWRNANDEVSIEQGVVRLRAGRGSQVRVTWDVHYPKESLVLCDAWERAYGDLGWRPVGVDTWSPWYFAVRTGDGTHCVGVKTGPSAFCSWRVGCSSISLLMDVRCGCLDTLFDGRSVVVCELVQMDDRGLPWEVLRSFCSMMCPKPKLPESPFYGGNDWYAYYSDTDFDKVLDHAKILAECSRGLKNRPFHTIDAGWQLAHNWVLNEEYVGGPFRYPNRKFGDMKRMADAIRDLGVRPGLWCRPLETIECVPPEACLRRERNVKYLDPSSPQARDILEGDVRTFVKCGYELIKIDFPVVDMFRRYGSAMTESVCEGDWTFHDRHHTSAEISLKYYRDVSVWAQGAIINACNTFSHLAAGVFASCRIGDDTSGKDWSRTVKYGVNSLAFRGVQHGTMYSADPDCVGITDKIPWKLNREWLRLLAYSGMPLCVSVDRRCYGSEVRDAIAQGFALASERHEPARPVDWDETPTPRRWQTFDGVKEFNWE